MRILWIKVGGLWPPNTGGRLRSLHILAELSRRHQLTLLTTHSSPDETSGLRAFLGAGVEVISVPFTPPKWRSARFPLLLARSWFSRLPVDLYKMRVHALRRTAERLFAAGEADVCVADFLCALPNVPRACPVPVVYFSHNVEHMIWRRLCLSAGKSWKRLPLELEWRKLLRSEADASRRARLTVAVSEADRAALSALAPEADIRAVDTGVDTSYFTPCASTTRPGRMVFVGSMDWQPNEDAMLHFIDSVLPLIRERAPAATLCVVGRNPSERLRRVAAGAGVEVTGTVDDVRAHAAAAEVYVVPLRIGGGTRLKIFEALAMAKAVVSTTVGAEGLPLEEGVHFLRADAPRAFADAVLGLLADPGRRAALGAAGRALVEARYSWPRVAAGFEAFIKSCVTAEDPVSGVRASGVAVTPGREGAGSFNEG